LLYSVHSEGQRVENNLKKLVSSQNQWDEILESEHYLLHCVDIEAGCFGFIRTSRALLSEASFIDGRSKISIDETLWHVPIDDALSWYESSIPAVRPNRFIFHSAFCGSTLLARVMDIDGKSFVLKEPSILAQLADIKIARRELYLDSQRWSQFLAFVLSQLNIPWSEDESNLIKPSNWVNSELRDLVTFGGDSKLVLLSQSPIQFLTAVFRSGGERIQYVYSFLSQIRSIFPEFHSMIDEVENGSVDTVNMFSRLMIISYAIQARAFNQAKEFLDQRDQVSCTYDDLMRDPVNAIFKIADTFELDLTQLEIERSIVRHYHKHSKVRDRSFSQDEMNSVDKEVLLHYQRNFDSAIEWLTDKMGPDALEF